MVARQARGLARMEQILDAAAAVVAEQGDAALTMTAVSRRAGISPGSLYQFYPGKRELLEALAERYAASLGEGLPIAMDAAAVRAAGLSELLDRTLDPFLDFTLGNPGFRALFTRLDTGPGAWASLAPIHDVVEQRLLVLFSLRAPRLDPARARRIAIVGVRIVKGVLPAVAAARGEEREAVRRELKEALLRYLGPYDEAG